MKIKSYILGLSVIAVLLTSSTFAATTTPSTKKTIICDIVLFNKEYTFEHVIGTKLNTNYSIDLHFEGREQKLTILDGMADRLGFGKEMLAELKLEKYMLDLMIVGLNEMKIGC